MQSTAVETTNTEIRTSGVFTPILSSTSIINNITKKRPSEDGVDKHAAKKIQTLPPSNGAVRTPASFPPAATPTSINFPAPYVQTTTSNTSSSPIAKPSLKTPPSPASSPSQTTTSKHQISNQLWIWEQLIHREQTLLEQLKSFSSSEASDPKYLALQQEIRSFFEHKMSVLLPFMESTSQLQDKRVSTPTTSPSLVAPMAEGELKVVPTLNINQQPLEVIIANRYIVPAPCIQVVIPKAYLASCQNASGSAPSFTVDARAPTVTLVLCAYLYYHLTDKEVAKTMDGKQDILQGVKRISIDIQGMSQTSGTNNPNLTTVITFSKLKILEVSSKHKHQPFSLVFAIEEYTKGSKKIIATTKSTLFQVLSRPTSTTYGNHVGGLKRSLSQEMNVSIKKEDRPDNEDWSLARTDSMENTDGGNMILQDITELLTLPQKEAAMRLGISESMLCKRFKESTRRKWPYRYLRKLDKVIKMLMVQENDGPLPGKEDKEKLERLIKEKDECLRPVKIRITANDRIMSLNNGTPTKKEPSTTSSGDLTESTNSMGDESATDDEEDQDDDQFVLETLKLLKSNPQRATQ